MSIKNFDQSQSLKLEELHLLYSIQALGDIRVYVESQKVNSVDSVRLSKLSKQQSHLDIIRNYLKSKISADYSTSPWAVKPIGPTSCAHTCISKVTLRCTGKVR